MKNKTILEYLNSSFLAPYLYTNITDITYNGSELYIENSKYGRMKAEKNVTNEEVSNFLSHLSNLCGKNFNSLNPILDISFLNYRLNAIHPHIAKKNNEGVYTFALRIYSLNLKISKDNEDFCSIGLHDFFKRIIKSKLSILISGKTGVGKTEFQKYLVGYMPNSTKIVLIEDLYETYLKEIYPNLDITSWVSFNNQTNIENEYQNLIKAALRNNPDWLLIAEIRGKEAKELYNAFSTGHPFITTVHAKSAKLSIKRFAKIMGENIYDNDVIIDLAEYIPFSIHLNKKESCDGRVIRYIESIIENVVIGNKYIQREIYNQIYGFRIEILSKKMKKMLGYRGENYEKNKK